MRPVLIALLFLGLLGTPGFAADPQQQHNSNALWFENWVGLSNAKLTVTAPDGTRYEIFATTGTPVFQLPTRDAADGIYRYELSAATQERETIVNPINNGRGDAASDTVAVSFAKDGAFTVSRGVIIRPEDVMEEDS